MIMNMMWRREKREVSFQRTENRTTARRLKASRAHDDAVELVMIMEETESGRSGEVVDGSDQVRRHEPVWYQSWACLSRRPRLRGPVSECLHTLRLSGHPAVGIDPVAACRLIMV